MYYEIDIAGMKRNLKLFKVSDDLQIAAFILYGDVEITKHAAAELLRRAPEFDIMLTSASKSIPLIYEMARQSGAEHYIVARKNPKLYMRNVHTTYVKSISTANQQTLCIDGDDAKLMNGKKVLIIDDVISTGGSLIALETLVKEVGGEIAGCMSILAEGDAIGRDDIIYLEELPLFDGEGNPKK